MTNEHIISEQRRFFRTDATKAVSFRVRQLQCLQQAIRQNESKLRDAIYADFKKSAFDTYTTELALVYHDIEHAIARVAHWAKSKRARTNLLNLPGRSYTVAEPLGVSLVIGAWNYPYQLTLCPVVAAIAAGNTIVLKPSELPSSSSQALTEMVAEHFDPAFFTIVQGGVTETTQLLSHAFDKVFFTGSVAVGKLVYQAAAKHLTPVTLELGGKSPALVTKDCDLAVTARRLVWAKFLNAGQTCIAPDHVWVDAALEERFLDTCKAEIDKAAYSVENGNYVQIINLQHFDRLVSLIDRCKVCHGGQTDREQRHIAPTLLRDVALGDPVMAEEVFGPVLPVLRYEQLDEALSALRERPRPLAAYVFTSSQAIRKRVIGELSFGGGAVNDAVMHITNPHIPFGGVGQSGIGSYHGEAGFRAFSHYKSILDKPTWIDPELRYSPHTPSKLKWLKRLMRP